MILIDSSGWIEYFTKGPLNLEIFREVHRGKTIIVPTIVLFEVYRKIMRTVSQEEGLSAVGSLKTFHVVDLTRDIALTAADLSVEHGLGMADSCILATAQSYNALLVTLDTDFSKIHGVKVLKRR